MFSYRSLLRQAWTVTWRNKYLWFFGLFASLTAAGGSWEYKVLTQNLDKNLLSGSYLHLSGLAVFGELLRNLGLGLINLFKYDFLTILNTLSLLIITVALVCFFIWLAVASQSALIDGVKKLFNPKKKIPAATIRGSLTDGHRHFWPVLGLNLLIKILLGFISFLITLPILFLTLTNAPALTAAYVVLFIIFIPLGTGLALMIKYAICYKVLDSLSFVASLEQGWRLFKKYWLISLEMAVILFIITLIVGGALLLILSALIMPLMMAGLIFKLSWLVVLATFIAIVLIIFIGSILTTFQIANWTGLFLRLKEGGILAKLERIFRK